MWSKIKSLLNVVAYVRKRREQRAEAAALKKRMEELRKRDPFIYK